MTTSFLVTGNKEQTDSGASGETSRKPEFPIDVVLAVMTVEML